MNQAGPLWNCVGRTPLLRIKSLSELTGCEIFGKAEFMNPGGSIKDRAAKGIIEKAERDGSLQPGGTIVEGTAGNTGIGLATLAPERGYRVVICMPNNQALEKVQMLSALGADVHTVPPCPFSSPDHFYHQARRIAGETPGAVWADQFENTANAMAHYRTTGPELLDQMNGKIDCLTLSAGTGGTIGGTSAFLKEKLPGLQVIVGDPKGSGIHDFVKTGAFSGSGSSITEGIGIMRLTANFSQAKVDDALSVEDQDVIDMLFHLAQHDGLFVGTSSALNAFAAYSIGMAHRGSGMRIVTFLCDHGSRYASKILNREWRAQVGLMPDSMRFMPKK